MTDDKLSPVDIALLQAELKGYLHLKPQIDLLENRIRGWKAYARIAWKENRKLKVYLEKEKQRVMAIQNRKEELEEYFQLVRRHIGSKHSHNCLMNGENECICGWSKYLEGLDQILDKHHPTKARDGGEGE